MSNARFSILQGRAVKDRRISDAQFRTLAALGTYTDEEGWCWPSLSTLGNQLGKKRQVVGRDIVALKKLGYLEVYPRYKDNVRLSNKYRLKFDLPPMEGVSPSEGDRVSPSEGDRVSPSEGSQNDPKNDPLNMGSGLSEEDKEQANAKMDAILEAARQAQKKYAMRADIPEPYLEYCDLFVSLTGLKPTKKNASDWLATFSEWTSEGLTIKDIQAAWNKANPENGKGFTVTRPGSLTGTAVALKAQAKNKPAAPKRNLVRAEDHKPLPVPDFVLKKNAELQARLHERLTRLVGDDPKTA
jgi:hypothetical protein